MKKQREKALNTKHEIEETAKILIAENGYTKTSISDIAARSGYSVGAFYGHFKSKEHLAADLYKQIIDDPSQPASAVKQNLGIGKGLLQRYRLSVCQRMIQRYSQHQTLGPDPDILNKRVIPVL